MTVRRASALSALLPLLFIFIAAGCGSAPRSAAAGVALLEGPAGERERIYRSILAVLERSATVVYKDYARGLVLATPPARPEPAPLCGVERTLGAGAPKIEAAVIPASATAPPPARRRVIHVQIEAAGEGFRVEVRAFEEELVDDGAPIAAFEPRLAYRIVREDAALETALGREADAILALPAASAAHAPREAALAGPRGARVSAEVECQTAPAFAPPGAAAAVAVAAKKRRRDPPIGAGDLEALGAHYLEEGRFALAVAALGAATELLPDAACAHFLLAHAEIARGEHAAAARSLARGLDVNPDWLGRDPAPLPGPLAAERERLVRAAAAGGTDRAQRFVLGYLLYLEQANGPARDVLDGLHLECPDDPHYLQLYRLAAVRAYEAAGLRVH